MFGYDFLIYYEAARALLAGLSPYQVPGFFSPATLAMLFAPFTMLPPEYARSVWVAVNLVCLVVFAKKKAPLAVAFAPMLFLAYVGQVDLFVVTLGMFGGWPGLVLATVKPQLAIWLWAYWLWVSPRKIKYALPVTFLIYLVSQLVYPWVGAWMSSTPGIGAYASRSASMFGLAAIVGPIAYPVTIGWAAQSLNWLKRDNFFRFMAVFNPISSIYSHIVLVNDVSLFWVILSWPLLFLSLYLHTAAPFILIPVGMAAEHYFFTSRTGAKPLSGW